MDVAENVVFRTGADHIQKEPLAAQFTVQIGVIGPCVSSKLDSAKVLGRGESDG